MKALLLIAHGSRKEAANQDFCQLAERIGHQQPDRFPIVVPAFLEFANPDINQGVRQCVKQGATRIIVIPYFLSPGNHVNRDIPHHLDAAREQNPDIDIRVSTHLGAHEGIENLLLDCADRMN